MPIDSEALERLASAKHTAFQVSIGGVLASSKAAESRRQLLQLQVELDMDGPAAHCLVDLADGNPPAAGDPVEVKLDSGGGMQTVFTGIVAGGEMGPVHSAGLLVVHEQSWPLVDLRVDWSDDNPIVRLRRLWDDFQPQMDAYITRALDPDAAPAYGVPGDPGDDSK